MERRERRVEVKGDRARVRACLQDADGLEVSGLEQGEVEDVDAVDADLECELQPAREAHGHGGVVEHVDHAFDVVATTDDADESIVEQAEQERDVRLVRSGVEHGGERQVDGHQHGDVGENRACGGAHCKADPLVVQRVTEAEVVVRDDQPGELQDELRSRGRVIRVRKRTSLSRNGLITMRFKRRSAHPVFYCIDLGKVVRSGRIRPVRLGSSCP